jgi:hypothetical protein
MACNQCTPCTNCTPPTPVSTSCEECADIISSSCVYYKGGFGNNLGLEANFRFNNFAEKVMQRFSSLPSSINDTQIDALTVSVSPGINQIAFVIDQSGSAPNRNAALDIRPYFAIVPFLTSPTISLTANTPTVLAFGSNIETNKHIVNSSGYINPETNESNGRRLGWQKLFAHLTFSTNTAGVATVQICQNTTVLASSVVTLAVNETATLYCQAFNNFSSYDAKEYNVKVSFNNAATITISNGTFEVKEYGF